MIDFLIRLGFVAVMVGFILWAQNEIRYDHDVIDQEFDGYLH